MQNGVIMAAIGPKYIDMAYRAAESVVLHNPGVHVDLFTDADRERGPFSRVHILDEVWIRSKVDAMLQSRFEKTLYLDVDLHVLADISEIFELLDRFDITATHDQYRNSAAARRTYKEAIPNAFPQVNSGVLGFRQSAPVMELLLEWKSEIKSHGIGRDQPSLRELLWNRGLKLSILPPEYNLWDLPLIDHMTPAPHAAPRILHSDIFRDFPKPPADTDILVHYLGKARAHKIGLLLAADETLAHRTGRSAQLPTRRQRNISRGLYALARTAKLRKTLTSTLKEAVGHSRSTQDPATKP